MPGAPGEAGRGRRRQRRAASMVLPPRAASPQMSRGCGGLAGRTLLGTVLRRLWRRQSTLGGSCSCEGQEQALRSGDGLKSRARWESQTRVRAYGWEDNPSSLDSRGKGKVAGGGCRDRSQFPAGDSRVRCHRIPGGQLCCLGRNATALCRREGARQKTQPHPARRRRGCQGAAAAAAATPHPGAAR